MRQRDILRLGSAILLGTFVSGTASARNGSHSAAVRPAERMRSAGHLNAQHADMGLKRVRRAWHASIQNNQSRPATGYASGPLGYQNYGWPYQDYGYYYSPQAYGHSSYFPYLYFYEQYAREAEESRRAADDFEVSLAREGKLTGPAPVGAFLSDHLPPLPRDVALIFDGRAVSPSPDGAPLAIESGQHTLHISGKPGSGQAAR